MGKVLVSSGEISGDRLLLHSVDHLVNQGHHCVGLGGQTLMDVGLRCVLDRNKLSVTGLTEALPALVPTLKAYRTLSSQVSRCDGLLLSDYPEVNLRLARRAGSLGVPTMYLAPPQAWAWRANRAQALKATDFVGCLFDFSTSWYRSQGVNASWIGHPLATSERPEPNYSGKVTIMPGSRSRTVASILPSMVKLLNELSRIDQKLSFVCARSPEVSTDILREGLARCETEVTIRDDVETVLLESQLVVAHPGTATLHATLRGCTVLTICNPSSFTKWVGRRMLSSLHLALPNILLNEPVFPEFVATESTPREWAISARSLLDDTSRFANHFEAVWENCYREESSKLLIDTLDRLFS